MYIKFVKDHPAGFKKGQIIDADLNLGNRLVQGEYASESKKEAYDKFIFDYNLKSRQKSLESLKEKSATEIANKQKEIDTLVDNANTEIQKLKDEIKVKTDKINLRVTNKKASLKSYKAKVAEDIKNIEASLNPVNESK